MFAVRITENRPCLELSTVCNWVIMKESCSLPGRNSGIAWGDLRNRMQFVNSNSSCISEYNRGEGIKTNTFCVCSVASVVTDFLQPYGLWHARLLSPWDSPGKNIGVDCHALLQGIFLIQGLTLCLLCLLHWQGVSLPLNHQSLSNSFLISFKELQITLHMYLLVYCLFTYWNLVP